MSVAVDEETFWLGDWRVEPQLNRIVRGEEIVKIDPRNMKVLQLLASQPGLVFSQAEIERAVWSDVIVTPNSVYQSIAQLRRALGDEKANPLYIETIARKGYRLVANVSQCVVAQSTSMQFDQLPTATPARRSRTLRTIVFVAIVGSALGALGSYYSSRHTSATTRALSNTSQVHSETPLTLSELPSAANLEPGLLIELSTVALAQGKAREAQNFLTRALEIEQRRVGDKHPAVGKILQELAMVYVWESDYASAEAAAYAALNAFERYPESHPSRIAATMRLGYVLLESGKYDSSEIYLSRALDLSAKVLGENSGTTSEALVLSSMLRYSQRRIEEAEQLARRGIAIAEAREAAIDTVGYYKSILVAILLSQSRYEEARDLCEEVLLSFENGLRANHPQVIAIRDLLAKSFLGLRRHQAAETIFRENIRLWKQNDGWSVRAAGSASGLGEALIEQGKLAEASEYLARASLEIGSKQQDRDARERFLEHQARLAKLELARKAVEASGRQMAEANQANSDIQVRRSSRM